MQMDTPNLVATVLKQSFYSYSPEEIKEMRGKLNMNMEEFGDLLFVEKATVSKWENGKRLPSTPVMRLLKFIEVMANDCHRDINKRIRKAY